MSHFTQGRVAQLSLESQSGGSAVDSGDDFSRTSSSPTDQTWFLPPSTPALLRDAGGDDPGKLGIFSAINIIVGKTIGVGAYTLPPAVLDDVGSVGMALLLWVVGALVSFCGLAVYLELGTALPRSGGERLYLERIFRRPRMLATCMFMAYAVLLGFSAPNAIVLGEYALFAVGVPGASPLAVRAIAVIAVSALCYLHARLPALGLKTINVLGLAKLLILVVVVVCGVAGGLLGVGERPGAASSSDSWGRTTMTTTTAAQRNFTDVWSGSSTQPYDYATALLKVVYCFRGYSTANQVLSDVRRPVRTLRVAAPAALGLVALAYLAVNVAFFLVVDKADVRAAGVAAADAFFRRLFGDALGARVLPWAVLVAAAGNIAATAFAQARVNEELARDGLLPWSTFWTTPPPPGAVTAAAPARGLLLHWAVSVAVIVLPPPGRVYHFLVDLGGYPVSVVSVAVSLGLLHLRRTPAAHWKSPAPAPRAAVGLFAAFNGLLLLLPWIPPAGGRGESAAFASYAYPASALAVLALGALYWCWWRTRGHGRAPRPPTDEPYQPDERRYFLEEEEEEEKQTQSEAVGNVGLRRRAPCGCRMAPGVMD